MDFDNFDSGHHSKTNELQYSDSGAAKVKQLALVNFLRRIILGKLLRSESISHAKLFCYVEFI